MGVGKNDSGILIMFPYFGEKLVIVVLNLCFAQKVCCVFLINATYQSSLVNIINNYGPDQIA